MNKIPKAVRYVSDDSLTWTRKKRGESFGFVKKNGKSPKPASLERIKKMAIPPSWTKVRISPSKKGHIQAVGLDAKGKKQYIYHPDWTSYNQQNKFKNMVRFGEILPTLRKEVAEHMNHRTLTRERILATVVWLLENTFIRIGNKPYERENKSYGLTTMRGKHVKVRGDITKFSFKGKSGVYHELDIKNPKIAKTIKKCIELPGYELFQYVDVDKNRQTVDSRDVNEYLQQIVGESTTAKDFRTWGGTTLAGITLHKIGSPDSGEGVKEALSNTVEEVSNHLGNTIAVCKKYYIHPKVFTAYERGRLNPHFKKAYKVYRRKPSGLSRGEYATWTLLKSG